MKRAANNHITTRVTTSPAWKGDPPQVRLRLDRVIYYMSTAEAYDLANRLVDAAERIEREAPTC